MKKKIILAAVISCLAAAAAGCGKSEIAQESTTVAETTQADTGAEEHETAEKIANSWADSDKEGVLTATNVELDVPEDAENVEYSYLTTENLGQVTFSRGNENWIYRAMMADKFEDISGMYYTWDNEEEVEVSGRQAVLYDYNADQVVVWMINWYDAVPGIMYSLSVTAEDAEDLDGLDMQGMAESLFVPMQDEVDGDMDASETENVEEDAEVSETTIH